MTRWSYGCAAPVITYRSDRGGTIGSQLGGGSRWCTAGSILARPRGSMMSRAVIAAGPLAAPDCPAFFVTDAPSRSMRELCALRRPAGVRHKVFLPQWFGTVCRRCDAWVQRRGGYVQNLHVLAELADPITIPADVATSLRTQLGLALVDQHAEGSSAERAMRG